MGDDGYLNEEFEEGLELLNTGARLKTASETTKLRELFEEKARQEALAPKCPYCGGAFLGQYEVCKHCGRDVIWIESKILDKYCGPYKKEEPQEAVETVHELESQSQRRELRAEIESFLQDATAAYVKRNTPKWIQKRDRAESVSVVIIVISLFLYIVEYVFHESFIVAHTAFVGGLLIGLLSLMAGHYWEKQAVLERLGNKARGIAQECHEEHQGRRVWCYRSSGQGHGPCSLFRLRELISNDIQIEAVRDERDMGNEHTYKWRPIDEFPVLFKAQPDSYIDYAINESMTH